MADKQLLDLSTKIERDFVTIDGENFDLCAVDDVSLDEFIWLGRGINSVQRELNVDPESAKARAKPDAAQMMKLLDEMTAKVLKAPAGILGKLSDFSKLAIITAFFSQATDKGSKSPIVKKNISPPDSKSSMVAVPKTG